MERERRKEGKGERRLGDLKGLDRSFWEGVKIYSGALTTPLIIAAKNIYISRSWGVIVQGGGGPFKRGKPDFGHRVLVFFTHFRGLGGLGFAGLLMGFCLGFPDGFLVWGLGVWRVRLTVC